MRYALLTILLLTLAGCGSRTADLRVLKRSSFSYPSDRSIKLHIGKELDRSGGEYQENLRKYKLETFGERISRGLQKDRVKVHTFRSAGESVVRDLINPFILVDDPTEADMMLILNVDGFEYGKVDVTSDRISFWDGFGITTYVGYSVVPRMLVGISCSVVDMPLGREVYSFQAKGVAVNRSLMREGYDLAMDRCVMRFYEKFLEQ
ncbi:MAG: hypothetical protein V1800_15170 [Candidatus Latescibacterota bacterium]